MRTEAVFIDLVDRISAAINKAERSILVVTENLQHPSYIKALLDKARGGCSVCLICRKELSNKQKSDFDRLQKLGGKYYPRTFKKEEFWHQGFCLIDDTLLITGNYNWQEAVLTYDAHVVFIYEDTVLVQMIHGACKDLLKVKDKEVVDVKVVEESKGTQLSTWNDPAVGLLQLDKKVLEHRLQAYNLEKIELEKVLHEFQHRHSMELGDLLADILHWRKEQFRDDPEKYQEAAADEEAYRKEVAEELKKQMFDLNDGEKKEIKKAFRKATHLCHPDKVNEAFREIAMQVFIKLKKAYDANNLKIVLEILKDLESRQFIDSNDEELSKSVALLEANRYLQAQIDELLKAIFEIQHSETYQLVLDIEDWDAYFKRTKEVLEKELAILKQEE